MKIKITERQYVTHDVPFTYPIFRSESIGDDHNVYWKFESEHKVTMIVDKGSEMSILTYDDPKANFPETMITSEDMLYGRYNYGIIPEKFFHMILERLIDLIHRS